MKLDFPNPVGLAAGYDRNGDLIEKLKPVGFGFIEIGTINVNSEIDIDNELNTIIQNLEQAKKDVKNETLIGISLGSLRDSIDSYTIKDYLKGLNLFFYYADYIVINLSRPGSSSRSEKNDDEELQTFLKKIKQQHNKLCASYNNKTPILVKVAIDYKNRNLLPKTIKIADKLGFDGFLLAFEKWPIFGEAVSHINIISDFFPHRTIVIVGGIKTENDVMQILNAGADLVQCYSLLAEQGADEMSKLINQIICITET